MHVLGPKGSRVTVFSTKRACPSCGRSFAELDPRLFSFNSKHGWCEDCFGTGVEMAGFDEEQSGEERWWNEWYDARAASPAAAATAQRLNPVALNVRFRERSIAALAAEPVERGPANSSRGCASRRASARSRATCWPRSARA